MKEFLSARGVDFVSRNVASDAEAAARLAALNAGGVPVVASGGRLAPGIDLAQVAELLELVFDAAPALPAPVLIERLRNTLATATRLVGQFPEGRVQDKLPNRDRTCLALANHIAEIAGGYLEVDAGRAFDTAVSAAVPAVELDRRALAARSRRIAAELARRAPGPRATATVASFFGPTTLHAVLERCAWHTAQHTRQLAMMLERMAIEPDRPLAAADLQGLPLPAGVWDS